ncbi:hypothetical protein [Maribacter sp. 2307ULW6-5]|uniref:hypothetical protein n=1 Tax=Maribacter sp. 2307ULW6-5 TaxID=3386275 RepID=UPI0039BCFA45
MVFFPNFWGVPQHWAHDTFYVVHYTVLLLDADALSHVPKPIGVGTRYGAVLFPTTILLSKMARAPKGCAQA